MFKSNFLNEISIRGFIHQATDIEDLDTLMNQKNITAYIGFDITSDSLHIGSLVQLMLLHWLYYFDHKVFLPKLLTQLFQSQNFFVIRGHVVAKS